MCVCMYVFWEHELYIERGRGGRVWFGNAASDLVKSSTLTSSGISSSSKKQVKVECVSPSPPPLHDGQSLTLLGDYE